MSIRFSASLTRRLNAEINRAIGSNASMVFYDGAVPATLEASATGNKVKSGDITGEAVTFTHNLPEGATYWRILDAGGLVVVQGSPDA